MSGYGMVVLPLERNGYTYRFANGNDYENVKSVVDEVFQYNLRKDNFMEYCNRVDAHILIVLKGAESAGLLCLEDQYDYFNNKRITIFVRNAGIREKFRRNGIFKQLFAIAYEYAVAQGAVALELTCANYRNAAHSFYLNNGFTSKKTTVFIRETKL